MARTYKKMYLQDAMRNRRSFAFIRRKGLGIKEVVSMYYPLHEADLSKFADAADNIIERT